MTLSKDNRGQLLPSVTRLNPAAILIACVIAPAVGNRQLLFLRRLSDHSRMLRKSLSNNELEVEATGSLRRKLIRPVQTSAIPLNPSDTLYYRRARFSTRLPRHYRYAPSHYWLCEVETSLFRIGLTRFATRMLGDFVERELQTATGDPLQVGQAIGWIEGFKAVADVYSVVDGHFVGANELLDRQPNLVDKDPYDAGWLYLAQGAAASNCVDCEGYTSLLDLAIDRMLKQQQQEKRNC